MERQERKEHWEEVYQNKSTDELTWYQRRPEISLELIERAASEGDDGVKVRLIDVGAGASTLEDHLVDDKRFELTALDIAGSALERIRERLGPVKSAKIDWKTADLTDDVSPLGPFDIWHDRAVFHFLTDPADRAAYRGNLQRAVPSGGHAILSTFSLEGPEKCSGLPVRQYSAETLSEELGPDWRLLESHREDHPTPWGGTQNFVYGLFRRQ